MTDATALFRVQLGVEWQVPLGGSLTLDETREYARATFTLPYNGGYFGYNPTLSVPPRVVIECQGTDQDGVLNTITADLHLRSIRAIDAETMEFVATSDELLLRDYGVMTEDYSGLVNEGSIRGAVNAVLGQAIPGAALEPFPNSDGPILVLDTDNLVDNPSLLVDRNNWLFWQNGSSAGTDGRVTGPDELGGPAFFRATFGGATSSPAAGPYYIVGNVQPRTVYAGSAWVRPNINTSLRFAAEFTDKDGAALGTALGPVIACPANVWTRIYHDVSTAPPTATNATVTMYGVPGTSPNWAAGNRIDAKALRFGPILSSPLTWQPGTSAWEYLMSLVATLGLRLFCDEERRWRLVARGYVGNASPLEVTPHTLSSITQGTSRDDSSWADGVVIVYEWEGADGNVRRKSDRAGSNGKVVRIDIRRPFPGRGAAQLHLDRLQMQALQYEFTTDLNLRVRPSGPVSITTPGEFPVGQRIQSMTIDFATADMTVTARSSA